MQSLDYCSMVRRHLLVAGVACLAATLATIASAKEPTPPPMTGGVTVTVACTADFNADRTVDVLDMVAVGLKEIACIHHTGPAVVVQYWLPIFIFGWELALFRGVLPEQVLHGLNEEARGAACRITYHLGGSGVEHPYHQINDVPRCSELAVDTRGCELAKKVLV